MMFPRTVKSVAYSTQITMDIQHIFYLCNISCIVTSIELKLYNEEQLQSVTSSCLWHSTTH